MAPTTFMNDRLLKAAQALAAQGERVELRYTGFGEWRDALFLGAGSEPKTVRLGVWCEAGEIKEGKKSIRFTDCLVPAATLKRLEQIARAQEGRPATELQRAEQFILFALALRNRTLDGQFKDTLHRPDPRSTR